MLAVAVFGVAAVLFLTNPKPKASPSHAGSAATAGATSHPGAPNPGPPPTPVVTSGGPPVTGRDASNFNVGSGCSDNPSDPLPGCRDSPSVPAGDPEGSCPNGITVDKQTTSCGLAESVYRTFRKDGPLSAYSPERRRSYPFGCFTAGPGTTGYRFCLGTTAGQELYVRWRP